MIKKLKNLQFKTSMKVMSAMAVLGELLSDAITTVAYASDFTWLTDPTQGNDTFEDLTTTVKQTGNSLYQLVLALSIIGLLVSILFVGAAIAITKNANKKDENKSHLLWVIIGGAVVFGAPSILGLIYSIGQGF